MNDYQLLPQLPDEDYQRLRADIAERGIMVPVEVDEEGNILDGHHRMKIAEELGIKCPTIVRRDMAEHDKRIHAVMLNLARRQLTDGQKVLLGERIEPDIAERALARRAQGEGKPRGVKASDVDKCPQETEATKTRDEVAEVVGLGSGRTYERNKKVVAKARELAPELIEKVAAGEVDIKDLRKEVNTRKAKQDYLKRQEQWDKTANTIGSAWEVRLGDFREVLADIEPGSIDAIITDPPYPDEYLPLWADLADLAMKLLRPGAPLIAWSGQYRLQQVLNHLSGPLKYQWTLCLDLPGSNARFRGPNMIQTWKPVIVCTAGTWGPHDWFKDRVTSPSKDQALYEWQQNPDPAGELIRRYVPEGGLILDPFTGVGSFGVAALRAGRRFLGVELDEGRAIESRQRLTEEDQS